MKIQNRLPGLRRACISRAEGSYFSLICFEPNLGVLGVYSSTFSPLFKTLKPALFHRPRAPIPHAHAASSRRRVQGREGIVAGGCGALQARSNFSGNFPGINCIEPGCFSTRLCSPSACSSFSVARHSWHNSISSVYFVGCD